MIAPSIFDYSNVYFDQNSEYGFEQLNESLYINNLIVSLKERLGEGFEDFDFFIFSNHTKDVIPLSKDIISLRKKVLLYFSDESGRDVQSLSGYYFAIFKSYIGNIATAANVFPLGIGYVKDVPEYSISVVNERKINVFFQGNLNKSRIDFYRSFHPLGWVLPSQRRLKAAFYRKALLKLRSNFNTFFPNSIIAFNGSFKSGLTTEKYGRLLSDSKIILCPKGFTQVECFRHYEAMRAGCIIVSEMLPEIEFYEKSPIIQVDDWKSGIKIIKELLADKGRMLHIQKETIKWWDNVCSEKGMAIYIVNQLQSQMQ